MANEFRWDPRDYAAHSAAQLHWARELLAKLQLRGDESLLDLGCGDGKVTAEIAGAVPQGTVIGVDSSPEMIAFAREAFPSTRFPQLQFHCMDVRSLQLDSIFDVVFSNAALHWVDDHLKVLRGVSQRLRPGGRLLISCGGKGNAAGMIHAINEWITQPPWRPFFDQFHFPYFFYGPEDYGGWLAQAGLATTRLELIPKDMIHPGREGLAGWLRTAWLPYTQRIPDHLRLQFIDGLVDLYLAAHPLDSSGQAHVRMVRLEVEALKP